MLKQKTKKNLKQYVIVSIAFLLVLTLFAELPNMFLTKALGGGFIDLVTNTVTTNSTTNAFTVGAQYAIDGNYFLISTSTFSPSISVSSVSDTASNTWTKAVSSSKFEDTEIWYMNYTKTQFASFTITVTFSATTESITQYQLLTGVITGSLQTEKNNGTATSLSVPSFTPNTNFACQNYAGGLTGSATTAFGLSNFWYARTANHLGATNFWSNTQLDNYWNPAFGSTTITTTMSPTASPQWDDIVSCFPEGPTTSTTTTTTSTSTTTTTTNPTMPSGGIQQFVRNATGATASTSLEGSFNLNSAIGQPVTGHFLIVDVFAFSGNSTVSTIGDTQTNTYSKLVSLNSQGDQELWISTSLLSTTTDVITVTMTVKTSFQLVAYEVSGITTNTPDTTSSNSGISGTSSVATVSVPINDFCIAPIGLKGTVIIPQLSSTPFGVFLVSSINLPSSNLPSIVANNMNGTNTNAQVELTGSDNWNELLSCFPSSNLNTITTISTTTGVVIPEPANSTDLVLFIFAFIIILVFLLGSWLMRDSSFGAFLSIVSGIISVYEFFGLNSAPTIVYGNNSFTVPSYFPQIMIIFAVVSFVMGLYLVFKSHGRW